MLCSETLGFLNWKKVRKIYLNGLQVSGIPKELWEKKLRALTYVHGILSIEI